MSITINKTTFATLDASIQAIILEAIKTTKPKRVLSDEQKAKMKAGREAAKLKKESVSEGSVPDGSVPEAKKRGPKKLADMTSEERTAHDAKVAARKATKAEKTETSDVEAEKPKRVLTDEHKAKMKAGREAAKLKKQSEARSVSPKAKVE